MLDARMPGLLVPRRHSLAGLSVREQGPYGVFDPAGVTQQWAMRRMPLGLYTGGNDGSAS